MENRGGIGDSDSTENDPLISSADQTQDVKEKPRGLLNPEGPYLRWIAVVFMCFLSFGELHHEKCSI